MENPLGLFRSQIYRLFKTRKKSQAGDASPTLEALKERFPWANEKELDLIRKEKLYLDEDFRDG